MAINTEGGNSIYCARRPFAEREMEPLYQAVRYWAKSTTGAILDIGCSDLPATKAMFPERQILGFDLSPQALVLARTNCPQAALAIADMTNFPVVDALGKVGCVFLLDVLEHLEYQEAANLLDKINTNLANPNLKVLVSMPIISPFSLPCIREAVLALQHLNEPRMGLFDSTHKLFMNQSGHKKLFQESGFEVEQEGYTSGRGIIGISYPHQNSTEAPLQRKRTGIKLAITYRLIPGLLSPFSREGRDNVRRELTAYQGLYMLQRAT